MLRFVSTLIKFIGGLGALWKGSEIASIDDEHGESLSNKKIVAMFSGEPNERLLVEVVGESYDNDDGTSRQDILKKLRAKNRIRLVRQPNNPHDKNAIAVFAKAGQVGHLSAKQAKLFAPIMDRGQTIHAEVDQVRGGYSHKRSMGLWLRVWLDD